MTAHFCCTTFAVKLQFHHFLITLLILAFLEKVLGSFVRFLPEFINLARLELTPNNDSSPLMVSWIQHVPNLEVLIVNLQVIEIN